MEGLQRTVFRRAISSQRHLLSLSQQSQPVQDQKFISRKLSSAQAPTAQVPPCLKNMRQSTSSMVPHYLVCEGISLLGFLCVFIDNEDIYSYTNRRKAAREQAV